MTMVGKHIRVLRHTGLLLAGLVSVVVVVVVAANDVTSSQRPLLVLGCFGPDNGNW
jgi:hypothetical protein